MGEHKLFIMLVLSLLFSVSPILASITSSGDINLNETFYLNSTTNMVGIGTATPISKLHVIGDVTIQDHILAGNWSNVSIIESQIIDLSSHTNLTQQNVIDYAGVHTNLTYLDILDLGVIGKSENNTFTGINIFNGPVFFRDNTSIQTPNTGIANETSVVTDLSGTHKILLNGSGNSWFNSGNVGIGTTAPGSKLHVIGNTNITGIIDSGTHYVDGILYFGTRGTTPRIQMSGNDMYFTNGYAGQMVFGNGVLSGMGTIDTGQGANQLYGMDQPVLSTSSPVFAGMTVNGQINVVGAQGTTNYHNGTGSDKWLMGIRSDVTGNENDYVMYGYGGSIIPNSPIVSSSTGAFTTVDSNQWFRHNGDTDTGMNLETDRVTLQAGNAQFLQAIEDTTDNLYMGMAFDNLYFRTNNVQRMNITDSLVTFTEDVSVGTNSITNVNNLEHDDIHGAMEFHAGASTSRFEFKNSTDSVIFDIDAVNGQLDSLGNGAKFGGSITLDNTKPIIIKNAAGTAHDVLMMYSDDHLYLTSDEDMIFRTTGTSYTEKMRLTKAGNVGIGTTAPSTKLEIIGNLTISGTGNGINLPGTFGSDSQINFMNTDNAKFMKFPLATSSLNLKAHGNGKLGWTSDTATGDIITFDGGNGNVGIGTTAPTSTLHVLGTANISSTANIEGKLTINDGITSPASITLDPGNNYVNIGDSVNNMNLDIYNGGTLGVHFAGSGNSYFNGGNVGIGTTNPTAGNLEIQSTGAGIIPAYFQADGADTTVLRVVSDTANNPTTSGLINIDKLGTGGGNVIDLVNAGTGNSIYVDQNANADAVLFDSTGSTSKNLWVYSNQNADQTASLVHFEADNAAFDRPVLDVQQDGTGYALSIDQNGAGTAIFIDSEATAKPSIDVTGSSVARTSGGLVKFNDGNVGTTAPTVEVVQAGTGNGIFVDQNGHGSGISVDNDGGDYGIYVNQADGATRNAMQLVGYGPAAGSNDYDGYMMAVRNSDTAASGGIYTTIEGTLPGYVADINNGSCNIL